MTQANANTGSGAVSGPQADATNMTMLGEVVWLMAHSKLHKGWPMASIFQWVVPALMHKQCRLYRRDGRPVAYVAWARMSKEVEEAYVLNPRSLNPKDWTSGERGWIVDWIAPFGDSPLVMKDLREGLFKDEVGRALRVKPGSDEMQIIYIHGANAAAKAHDETLNPPVDLEGASKRAAHRSQLNPPVEAG
ncbi:toxin-activating lysine-acyltransferase [uncultured Rhodoferax sp.]|uniref:toxin-activating lysine-acyltransferase n=1 Tax=uncultured Rhodoferax sp. TaxID=223188 RepID=UPI0025CD060F|nr:toxin-activating lysine-acyltransferase [uncultured Rhodoferax sp.]